MCHRATYRRRASPNSGTREKFPITPKRIPPTFRLHSPACAGRRCDSDEIVPVSMAGTENYASLRRFIIEPKTRLGVIEGATSCTSVEDRPHVGQCMPGAGVSCCRPPGRRDVWMSSLPFQDSLVKSSPLSLYFQLSEGLKRNRIMTITLPHRIIGTLP